MVFVAFPTYPTYDSQYALLWAGELVDGAPGFDDYRAPTQHPLLLPVGLVLAPFGDAGARVFVGLCLAAGRAARGHVPARAARRRVPGGIVAGGLLLTRLNFGLLASIGFLDIPYCALLAWAIALEVERPRRGGAVSWLLGLAGLLRPEAWLLAGLYGLWLGAAGWWRGCGRWPAAAAPVLWAAIDLVVTGDPLFSIHHTDALAAELQRERPYRRSRACRCRCWRRSSRCRCSCSRPSGSPGGARPAAGAGGARRGGGRDVATYYVIATGGLATVYRYLLPAGLGLLAFAAFALTGWTPLPAGSRARGPWIAAAALAALVGAGYTALRLSPSEMVDQLRERTELRAELSTLLHDPAVARASACGPITVPNHKLLPEVRWVLALPERRCGRARTARWRRVRAWR